MSANPIEALNLQPQLPVGAYLAHVLRHCLSEVIMLFGSRGCQALDPDDLLKSIDNRKVGLAIS